MVFCVTPMFLNNWTLEMPLEWNVSGQMATNHFGNNLIGLSANIVPVIRRNVRRPSPHLWRKPPL